MKKEGEREGVKTGLRQGWSRLSKGLGSGGGEAVLCSWTGGLAVG